MPDRKLVDLCGKISTEKDPGALSRLIDDLIKLLDTEQEEIKAKIRANIGRSTALPD